MTYLKHIASLLLALLVFSIASVNATESITYIHTDHLGSPIAATNEDGSVKWTEDYQPFGVQRTNQDSDNTTGFTGHQHDDALDLTYMQARWYHPEVGRFMALDPLNFRTTDLQSFGRYTYASNNPYKYLDPDGKESSLAFRLDNRVNRLASGEITRAQYSSENRAEAVGGLAGGAVYLVGAREVAQEATSQITGIEIPGVKSIVKKLVKGKGLGVNPFKGKTPQQIDNAFRKKGFDVKGTDPVAGKGSYINPKAGRKYYIDKGGKYKKGTELPHVDVHRPPSSSLPKKKLPLGDRLIK